VYTVVAIFFITATLFDLSGHLHVNNIKFIKNLYTTVFV